MRSEGHLLGFVIVVALLINLQVEHTKQLHVEVQ